MASSNTSSLDARILKSVTKATNQIKGLTGTLMIEREEQLLFAQSFGLADRIIGYPQNLDSQYMIASITKQFSAAALLYAFYEHHKNKSEEEEHIDELIEKDLHRPLSLFLHLIQFGMMICLLGLTISHLTSV